MIARLPTVTHSTVWRIPVSDYEPLPRVWSCPPTFNDRETAHGDAFNGLAHSSLRLRTITTSLVLSTDLLMIARLPTETHSTVWRIPVSITNHYHEFGPVHRSFNDRETVPCRCAFGAFRLGLRTITTSLVLSTDLLMIARLPMVTHSTVWRIPVSDYEPLPRVWSCPPTFNDRETAHGDAFNGLAHSSLRLRTITTSLVLSTDLLMIARLPTETHSTVWRIPVSDTNHYHEFGPVHRSFDDRETVHAMRFWRISVSDYELLHEFGPVHRSFNDRETAHGDASRLGAFQSQDYEPLPRVWSCPPTFNDRETATETHSTVWRIPVSDYEPLPRVWSCPPTFNDRETAHGDAFNGLAHSSLRLRTITTSLVLSTDLLMIARLPTETHSTVWRIPVSDTNHYHEFGPVHRSFDDRETVHADALWRISVSDYELLPRVWSCPPIF
ncbi:hypothetical protein DMN91_001347 [Ooceraea biroi]|uniref:Uncharacterized protein n=1 Tax=Ooceraea biroi TaxID=2015173 RepID=A0A3L8E563_OOCBI|nr:hypothetical protein DMN91_001347 [Ooceraea biroi]